MVGLTDGVPLFVEEMVKAMLESGAERGQEFAGSVPSVGLSALTYRCTAWCRA